LEFSKQYEDTNGQLPENLIVSREVLQLMQKNAGIITESGQPVGSVRTSLDSVNSVLKSYGLPQLTVITSRKLKVYNFYTGAEDTIEFMPENRVIMVSAGVGEFLIGPTVENDFNPGISLDTYDKQEPMESVIKAVAAGFPAVAHPGLILHADVYTPGA